MGNYFNNFFYPQQNLEQVVNTVSVPDKKQLHESVCLVNYVDGTTSVDSLLRGSKVHPTGCTEKRCVGSQMFPKRRDVKKPCSKDEMIDLAKDFIKQYYESMNEKDSVEHKEREAEVLREIEEKGTYNLTFKELSFGCRTAWRNAPRCINRIQWRNLTVFDQRDARNAEEMCAAMINHIRYCTNPAKPGVLRSAITVFPAAIDADHEYRVWNPQFIKYAGYKMEDGSILGDPSSVEFTEVCVELGWQPPKVQTNFDMLPLVLQANGGEPQVFKLDPSEVLEVPLTHPMYPEFDKLKLKWYAVPGVSCLMLEIGGLKFTAAPFSGWYLVPEIATRDLADPQRYNMLGKMAEIMKLDTKMDRLWRDKALVELNVAVLHSYNANGVSIMDHHSGSESFMKFLEQEVKTRGGCPADWVWLVPPLSGGVTEVFHQEMLLYHLTPSYEYQENPWVKWRQSKKPHSSTLISAKERFRRAVRVTGRLSNLMQTQMTKRRHCVILYATETGKSESFAKMLHKLFGHAFNPEIFCMESYNVANLQHEELVLIVTSTFGNGEPPNNGVAFAENLVKMRAPQNTTKQFKVLLSQEWVSKLPEASKALQAQKFSVFGLGSRAYPDTFCAFAHLTDKLFSDLGAECIQPIGEGDELCGQMESFKEWAFKCYNSACKHYNLDLNLQYDVDAQAYLEVHNWGENKYRLKKSFSQEETAEYTTVDSLKEFFGYSKLFGLPLKERVQLQSPQSERSTIRLVLDSSQAEGSLAYEPGDHLSIIPENDPALVTQLADRLDLSAVDLDDLIQLEYNKGGAKGDEWIKEKRFPHAITLRDVFTKYLDITTPPSPQLLHILASQSDDEQDKRDMEMLAKGQNDYEEWRHSFYPNLVETLNWFSSLCGRVDPALLVSQLPSLQPRYYSISSSPRYCPGEIHLTVAVVKYNVRARPDGHSVKQGKVDGPVHFGVCSNWLQRLEIGKIVPAFVRKAPSFHLPVDSLQPVIMVGPGTGIAPFRSFWEERMYQLRRSEKDFGEMYLFFGCRQRAVDSLYESELKEAQEAGALKDYFIALSREPKMPKSYAQDKLKEQEDLILQKVVSEKAHIFVCGDISMANGVSRAFRDIFMSTLAMTEEKARDLFDSIKEQGRYHEDIFGVTLRTAEVTDKYRKASKRLNKIPGLKAATEENTEKDTDTALKKKASVHSYIHRTCSPNTGSN